MCKLTKSRGIYRFININIDIGKEIETKNYYLTVILSMIDLGVGRGIIINCQNSKTINTIIT